MFVSWTQERNDIVEKKKMPWRKSEAYTKVLFVLTPFPFLIQNRMFFSVTGSAHCPQMQWSQLYLIKQQ